MTAWLKDVAERVLATYVEGFIGILIGAEVFSLEVDKLEAAAVAALPAALAVLKGAVAKRFGRRDTAAFD